MSGGIICLLFPFCEATFGEKHEYVWSDKHPLSADMDGATGPFRAEDQTISMN